VKASVLDHIVCPACFSPLELHHARTVEGEIASGELRCAKGHSYPVGEGVPNLVVGEAQSADALETEQSFSAKWMRAPDYRKKVSDFYVKWFLDRYGFKDLSGLKSFLADKTMILDAGTGTGRDAKTYVDNSTAEVFGIDISKGVEVAYQDLGATQRLNLLRADIQMLPFAPDTFDFVACDQVLHHTENPRNSLEGLLRVLRPGGTIAFYVYRRKGPIREFVDDYVRNVTTRMSDEECYRFSETITRLGKALADLNATVTIPEDVPLLDIKAGTYDVQRFFYWNVMKCFWNEDFDFSSNAIINFDWYSPTHAYRYGEEEVQAWCSELGLNPLRFDVVEAGISVLATKG
jgi:SAM-dependent methyltransferase